MKYLSGLFVSAIAFAPSVIFAADGIVTCKAGEDCNFCELMRTLDNVIDWTVGIAVLIAIIGLMYNGFRMSSSQGDVSAFSAAKERFINVTIGIFVVMIAWLLIDTILKTLVGGDFGVWRDVSSCTGEPGMFDVNTDIERAVDLSPHSATVDVE